MAKWIPAWPAAGPTALAPDVVGERLAGVDRGESLRARLRAETRDAHERLDAAFAGIGRGDNGNYLRFLGVNEACLARIEPILAVSPLASEPGWRFEPRHAAALADLAAFGEPPLATAPFPIAHPSLAESIGIAYVLEGSRLGARMILRIVRRAEGGETKPPPTAFLGTAEGTDQFKAFLTLAERLVPDDAGRNAAVDAANATFGYFLDADRSATRRRETSGAN